MTTETTVITKYAPIKLTEPATGWAIKAMNGDQETIITPDTSGNGWTSRDEARKQIKALKEGSAEIAEITNQEPEATGEAEAEEVVIETNEGPGATPPNPADIARALQASATVEKARPYEPFKNGAANAIHPTAAKPEARVMYAAAAHGGRLFLKVGAALALAGKEDGDGITWKDLPISEDRATGWKDEASARVAIHRLLNAGLLERIGDGKRAVAYAIPEGFMAAWLELATAIPV